MAVTVAEGGTEFGTATGVTAEWGGGVAFGGYLGMRRSDLYRCGNFKLLANWVKCINVLGRALCCAIIVLQPH
jgi:hypothetical protein